MRGRWTILRLTPRVPDLSVETVETNLDLRLLDEVRNHIIDYYLPDDKNNTVYVAVDNISGQAYNLLVEVVEHRELRTIG